MLSSSVLTWVTCTGAILGLLAESPVVVYRAAAGSVSSRVWENFPPPAPQQRREGRLWQTGSSWCWTVSMCVLVAAGQLPSPSERHTAPRLGWLTHGAKHQTWGGLCGSGLKAALPKFTLHGRYTLTELSFYLQTEQLYWKRFSKHGTAQCYVY